MCSLELCNWYENRFPNDFKQLIQIKHYNISELSFLLSKIWYKLDYGEKLLMCAVYYDDLNLAKQMLNEKQFKVNPFYDKHYQVSSSSRHCSSNTSSNFLPVPNELLINESKTVQPNVFVDAHPLPAKLNTARLRRHSLNKEEIKCWCKNDSYLSRASLSVNSTAYSMPCENIFDTDKKSEMSQHYEKHGYKSTSTFYSSLDSMSDSNAFPFHTNQETSAHDMFSQSSAALNTNTQTSYFLNHALCELSMQSPFYFAIKLNNLRMCQLFVDSLKKAYLTLLNAKLIKRHQIQLHINQMEQLNNSNCLQNHRNLSTSSSYSSFKYALKSSNVHLNSMLSNSELTKLLMISLSNRNHELAILILSNVNNPKQILNFQHLSESFIYNETFCLYLLKNKIVDIKVLLKEACTRHATSTTYYLVNYLEQMTEKQLSQASLFNVFKCVLSSSILIGDVNIFRMLIGKLAKHLGQKNQINTVFPELTIKNVLTNNYQTILEKLKMSTLNHNTNFVDFEMTKKLARTRGLDTDLFYQVNDHSQCLPVVNQLSYSNRLKLFRFLFDSDQISAIWSELETKTKKKLSNYDKIFAAHEYDADAETASSTMTTKRFYLGRYLVYAESEPFLVGSLLDNFNDSYRITHSDLIQASKSEISELSIYYMMNSVNSDFSSKSNENLLDSDDDLYGNFVEILFCRMAMCCNDSAKEQRLRHLFLKAVILKNAKMTCSTNLLNLFMAGSEQVNKRLRSVYFPCLFYLSQAFLVFKTDMHKQRFNLLVNWFARNFLLTADHNNKSYLDSLNEQQIEAIIFEYYAKKSLDTKFNFNFDFTLQELSRNSFLKLFTSSCTATECVQFVDAICDSARQFIFYFNEIKSLF